MPRAVRRSRPAAPGAAPARPDADGAYADLRIELVLAPYGAFYWRLVGGDGRLLASSESFATRRDCRAAIDALRAALPTAPLVDRTPGRMA